MKEELKKKEWNSNTEKEYKMKLIEERKKIMRKKVQKKKKMKIITKNNIISN